MIDADLCDDDRLQHNKDCQTERLYIQSNQYQRLRIALCIGLNNQCRTPLLDPANEAWSAQLVEVPKSMHGQHYKAEVKRWSKIFDIEPSLKPTQRKIEGMTKWLMDHPLQSPCCKKSLGKEGAHVN